MSTCKNTVTLMQHGPTCWFNSLLMAVFYSEGMRGILHLAKHRWKSKDDVSKKVYNIFREMIDKRYRHAHDMREEAYKYFELVTPEYIMDQLNVMNPNMFIIKSKLNQGYNSKSYLVQLMRILDVGNFLLLNYDDEASKQLYVSPANFVMGGYHNENDQHGYMWDGEPTRFGVLNLLSRDTSVLAIHIDNHHNTYNFKDANNVPNTTNFKLQKKIKFNHKTYRLDSLMLTNFNSDECKKGHEIAGVTCNGERYLYNGWVRSSTDSSMLHKHQRDYPCELMKYEWFRESDDSIDFCLDAMACGITKASTRNNDDLCFSFVKGPRTYIYVIDDVDKPNYKLPKTIDKVCPIGQIYDHKILDCQDGTVLKDVIIDHKKEKAALNKKHEHEPTPTKPECPQGKELNPKTGRCIKSKATKSEPKNPKCPQGKELNPKTGRCIKIKAAPASKKPECPEGKELNPKTGRCVKIKPTIKPKKCEKGKKLNPQTGRCIKIKCPEGKKLNPKTGRCTKA